MILVNCILLYSFKCISFKKTKYFLQELSTKYRFPKKYEDNIELINGNNHQERHNRN